MSGNKTVETGASVEAFLDAVEPERRARDAWALDAVFREVTGGDRPYWLNEGFAEQIERASRGRAVSTRSERAALRTNVELGAWIPLASIADSFVGLDDEEARNACLQSVVTVGYIHDQTNVEQRRRLLERIGSGFSVDQALHEVLGVDTEGLDAAVRAHLQREFPGWATPASVLEGALYPPR